MTVKDLIKLLEDADERFNTPTGAAIPLPRSVGPRGPSLNSSTLTTSTGGTVILIIQD